MSYRVKLNLINRSQDTNNNSIVIFLQNIAESFGEKAVAWKVIKNSGQLDNHPFVFSLNLEIATCDSYGNYSPKKQVSEGDAYEHVSDIDGNFLQLANKFSEIQTQIEIRNSLKTEAISVLCYKDGKLLAVKENLAPGKTAFFEFKPRIYIGVISLIEEGTVINSDIISQCNTEIDLKGILSADIVMTGGGSGNDSTPFNFTLENILIENNGSDLE